MNSKINSVSDTEFTRLLKPHYNDLLNYSRALCSGSSKAEAEDVIQQALLKAFESFSSLQNKNSFRSWAFRIVTRCFYDSIRRPFWEKFVSLSSEEGKVAYQVYEDGFFEENQLLIGALSKISKKERVAVLLFEIGGFSIQEITNIQNEKSESAVKSRLSRSRKKLKEFMVTLEQESVSPLKSVKSRRVKTQGFASPQAGHMPQLNTKDIYHETSEVIKEIKSIG